MTRPATIGEAILWLHRALRLNAALRKEVARLRRENRELKEALYG